MNSPATTTALHWSYSIEILQAWEGTAAKRWQFAALVEMQIRLLGAQSEMSDDRLHRTELSWHSSGVIASFFLSRRARWVIEQKRIRRWLVFAEGAKNVENQQTREAAAANNFNWKQRRRRADSRRKEQRPRDVCQLGVEMSCGRIYGQRKSKTSCISNPSAFFVPARRCKNSQKSTHVNSIWLFS